MHAITNGSLRASDRPRLSDETGLSMVVISAGFLAFFAATTLAIDVGFFMTARTQAQNSADAGALAGAVAFVYNSFDDRSPGGPAVQSAINTALSNKVGAGDVSVGPEDVEFPMGSGGQFDRVKVTVYRTVGRNNPIPTLIGPVFGVNNFDILATATAEAAPANAMTCVKPFTIPDRWTENNAGPWTPDSTYDRYDKKGKLIENADSYVLPGNPGYNGYDMYADRGMPLTLRASNETNIAPTFYFSWKMPGEEIGADWYRDNIAGCNQAMFGYLSEMTQEPGNMMGPTMQGIDDLIAQDPNAHWDMVHNEVKSDLHPSPRVFPIPLYDPEYYAEGKANGRNASLRMANWIGFFVESRSGNEVYGRITPITGTIDESLGPAPEGMFPRAIRLVQ
jgi:hypothetical protein